MERQQAGIYQCTADNGVGDPVSVDIRLDVLCKFKSLPKILIILVSSHFYCYPLDIIPSPHSLYQTLFIIFLYHHQGLLFTLPHLEKRTLISLLSLIYCFILLLSLSAFLAIFFRYIC